MSPPDDPTAGDGDGDPDPPDDREPDDGTGEGIRGDTGDDREGDDFEWGTVGEDDGTDDTRGDGAVDDGEDGAVADPPTDSAESGTESDGFEDETESDETVTDAETGDTLTDAESDDAEGPGIDESVADPGVDDAGSGEPLLAVRDLDVSYGKTRALSGASVTVDRGEIVGVIGPNGAGKTTLMEAIGGFVDYEGTIRFDGQDLGRTDPGEAVDRGLIYCTEDRDLFPFFSVHENLLMGAQARDDRDAVREDLEMVYDLFPRLDDRRDQDAETMSGGEQQMLAIGRALMGDPELLMLDEPTLGLAPVIIEDISDAIERLREEGLTIFLAEQNSTFALDHADRLVLLENGEIQLSGTAEEFRDNEYVRDAYIGIH